MEEQETLSALRAENARLIALLEKHGIDWRLPAEPAATPTKDDAEHSQLSTDKKLALFRTLFRGRQDVFALRWENRKGESGYTPACANEWRTGICGKPAIKCSSCNNRVLIPITDATLYDHLAGKQTIGIYPLLTDDTCHFLAVDFDDADWKADAQAFAQSCHELNVPVAIEISRSGAGAHAWIFFTDKVSAQSARKLGTALISHTCARTRQLKLRSYDRLFPNQDTMPKGGFGNLIALPLQKHPRENNRSVFVDHAFQPHTDQWAFLASQRLMQPHEIEPTILRVTAGGHPLDVTFIDEEDQKEPWKTSSASPRKLNEPMPSSIKITQANGLYFEKNLLPQALANRLIRIAAFQNPEFYKAQAMRMPVWNKPRIIGCAENFPHHIALPRRCFDAVNALLCDNEIQSNIHDARFAGTAIDVVFTGVLRQDQEAAITAMLNHDVGVLCAPTAFGKTVTAAAIIARRATNTLILVHRTELLKQWQERLQTFLGDANGFVVAKGFIGIIGGGRVKPTGKIDVAVMQSLSIQGKNADLIERYGQVIVDECHHVSANSFDTILKRAKAKYVLGLTATPIRRDGLQPIIFMQCGPIRHRAAKSENAPHDMKVITRHLHRKIELPQESGIQDVFRHLANDAERTSSIVAAIKEACGQGRKVLVLTERTEHLDGIATALTGVASQFFVLHGRMSKKQRTALINDLNALAPDAPRILLATGKLVGEGFDHPPLDTLVLAMPISWAGTLQQYAGRLHREHATKLDVRIIDFIDNGHPALRRMWEKRRRGYQVMGYRVEDGVTLPLFDKPP